MDKNALTASAKALQQPPKEAALAYGRVRDALAVRVTEQLSGREDLDRLIGEGNAAMMENNHHNHALFMEATFLDYDPEQFVETIIWVFRAYRSHGFHLTYWPAQLEGWLTAMKEQLAPEHYAALAPLYEWIIVHIPAFTTVCESEETAWEERPHG